MEVVDVTFDIPSEMEADLASGKLERVGGVVRDSSTKQVRAWLRETGEQAVSESLALSSVAATAGVLNLAVSTMGFAVVMNRLGVIEQQLLQSQVMLEAIDYKIDLSFYAKFRAALNLALNAFTMENAENRRTSAFQAIERFSEAEHYYKQLVDKEIANGSQVADDYLATLSLSYITEVRCYLELEELGTAQTRLSKGLEVLKPRYKSHIETLLTSNPAAYLHPRLKQEIDLSRLTKVYQWIDPSIKGESEVFDLQRENLFTFAEDSDEWKKSLPQAISIPKTNGFLSSQSKKLLESIPKGVSRLRKPVTHSTAEEMPPELEVYSRLPETLSLVEQLIEDANRLETYHAEVETVDQLGIEFAEWRQLTPQSDTQNNESGVVFITIAE
jgi:hypothetical protein